MKILFIGSVKFSKHILDKIIYLNSNVVGVCTKKESLFNSDFFDLSKTAKDNNIPFRYVKNINSEKNIAWIEDLKPDIIFCIGWSSLIKTKLLKLTKKGVVGYHPTKLPHNRGRHPIIWSLVLGLKKSASTFFFMNEGADDGDIISQVNYNIEYKDDAYSVYTKLASIAEKQVEDFVPKLEKNTLKRISQDHSKSNNWRKRNKLDGKIDFRMTSYAIYNLVRAITKPYIGAHVEYQNLDVKIWRVEEVDCELNNIEPGKVIESNSKGIIVKTYDNAIKIIDHEFPENPKEGEYL